MSVVDINSDGLMDLYIAGAMNLDKENRLYVNQGLNSDGIPVFLKNLQVRMELMIKGIVWVQLL